MVRNTISFYAISQRFRRIQSLVSDDVSYKDDIGNPRRSMGKLPLIILYAGHTIHFKDENADPDIY